MRHLIALALALGFMAGCSPTDEVAGAPEEVAEDESAGEISISIGDFFFEPSMISLSAGDTVTWSHDGDVTHNVTARDGSFASDNLGNGETFSHTFETAGSFEYRCTLHGQMVASLEVG